MIVLALQTIGYDPVVSKEAALEFNVDKMELEEIWPLADYITVHTPYMPQTHRNDVINPTMRKNLILNCQLSGSRFDQQ